MSNFRSTIKSAILRMIPTAVQRLIINNALGSQNIDLSNIHFSQEGEDVILDKVFIDQKKGFYVDVGAHHPLNFSNTYKYYLRGWNGINIDAMPGAMEAFKKMRPRDTNLEIGISDTGGALSFHIFDQPGLNTFDKQIAEKHSSDLKAILKKVVEVPTAPLSELLDKHLPSNQNIDFLTIDAEGFDLKVLQSNNWDKYQPNVILVESIDGGIKEVLESEIYRYLVGKGYNLISKTFHTSIYQKMQG